MATLCLGEIDGSAPLLRDWLADDWALLFSHPADFQDQGLERDRWLQILRDEFRAHGVRPIACRPIAGVADSSWVGELMCDYRLLRLQDASATDDGVIDRAACTLRDQLQSLPPRFVLIIDQSLRPRGVLKYSAGRSTLSPLDLLASIDAFRRRSPHAAPSERRVAPASAARVNAASRALA